MTEIQLSGQHNPNRRKNDNSLVNWSEFYLSFIVGESSLSTFEAKKRDLKIFISFAIEKNMSAHIQGWTPSLTKGFQEAMLKRYSAATVKRMIATLGHFARWLQNHITFLASNPMAGVPVIRLEECSWNGLKKNELMQLKSAVDIRLSSCKRKDQNPKLEAAIFYLLLHTGLRESELVNLDFNQYSEARMLFNVRRKGSRVTKKILVPKEAKKYLDDYLAGAGQDNEPNSPLFRSRGGKRLSRIDVYKICKRISKLTPNRIKLSPHMLRHTFLKRVTDKYGVHVAQRLSGNSSIREIFRYATPSENEIEHVVESLWI